MQTRNVLHDSYHLWVGAKIRIDERRDWNCRRSNSILPTIQNESIDSSDRMNRDNTWLSDVCIKFYSFPCILYSPCVDDSAYLQTSFCSSLTDGWIVTDFVPLPDIPQRRFNFLAWRFLIPSCDWTCVPDCEGRYCCMVSWHN